DGRDYPNRIIFKEVVEQQRIVYAHDDGGELDVPIEFDSQIIFESIGDKTKLTLRTVFPTTEARDRVERENGAVQGGIEHVARLAEHLAAEVGGSTAALTITLPDDRRTILTRA